MAWFGGELRSLFIPRARGRWRAAWLFAALAATGCDGSECTFNSDCAAGTFCSAGSCAQECTGDEDCAGSGETCSIFGQCVEAPDAGATPDAGPQVDSGADSGADPCEAAGSADADGDGVCATEDCDETRAEVHPGAAEICTPSDAESVARDESCDGVIDEGCPWYFGRPHPVVAVHTGTGAHWFPRLSTDALTVRFGAVPVGGGGFAVHRAVRADRSAPFAHAERDPDFAAWTGSFEVVIIRHDGLEAFAQSGTTVVRAARSATSEPFGAPELFAASAIHPFLSSDGLELFVEDRRVAPSVIAHARRSSIAEPFGAIEPLGLAGPATRHSAPFITPDGLTLLFMRVAVSNSSRLFTATRPSRDAPFGAPIELVGFDDDRAEGPFFSATSRELFYSSSSPHGPAAWSIFRVQVCRDGPCVSARVDCATGVRSEDGLRCYSGVTTPAPWADAEADCASRGGHLASIHSAPERAIVTVTGGATFWIGANDGDTEGAFAWTSGEPITRTFWQPGQPNDLGMDEDCVFAMAGTWYDNPCTAPHPYVCETEVWPTW